MHGAYEPPEPTHPYVTRMPELNVPAPNSAPSSDDAYARARFNETMGPANTAPPTNPFLHMFD